MDITVTINSCKDCRHKEHSGAFTSGGAKPVCGHSVAVNQRGDGWSNRVIPYRTNFDKISDKPYRIAKSIPNWCPLKNGAKY